MRRIAIAVCGLLLGVASLAHAQAQLSVGNLCESGFAFHTVTNTCLQNTGVAIRVLGSYRATAPGSLPGFVGTESVVDLTVALTTLPDWWRFDACRAGSFAVTADPTITGYNYYGCTTPWDATPAPLTQVGVRYPGWGANQIQLIIDSTLPAADAIDLPLSPDIDAAVFSLTIDKAKSSGTGACIGCQQGACLHLRDVALRTLSDPPGSVFRVRSDGSSVTYNAGAPICIGDPVRNRTWGTIKSLYR